MTFFGRLRRAVHAGYRPPKNITRAKDVFDKFEQAAVPLVTVTETGAEV